MCYIHQSNASWSLTVQFTQLIHTLAFSIVAQCESLITNTTYTYALIRSRYRIYKGRGYTGIEGKVHCMREFYIASFTVVRNLAMPDLHACEQLPLMAIIGLKYILRC